MKRSQTTPLDELMIDIIHIHSSLWPYSSSDEDNLKFIEQLRNTPTTKWFIEFFVKNNRRDSLKHIVKISEETIGMWGKNVSYFLTKKEIIDKIQEIYPSWQQYVLGSKIGSK